MKEINFNQSRKDLTEAKIHHMLTEVMAKPQLRQRKYRSDKNDYWRIKNVFFPSSKPDIGTGFVNKVHPKQ